MRPGALAVGTLLAQPALLPLTVPEVRRLLWQLVWAEVPLPDRVLHWSRWRRRHQARARRCHYRRCLTRLYDQLRL
jgi:hypothetical protein